MKTIENIFLETKNIFKEQASQAVEEALDKIYREYLPHVETDTQSNVYFQSTEWIYRYLTDSLREDDFKIDILAADIRRKIWDDNKDELKKLISQDVSERLKELEQEHLSYYQHSYYWGE